MTNTNPPEPTTTDELIGAATLLATGCTVHPMSAALAPAITVVGQRGRLNVRLWKGDWLWVWQTDTSSTRTTEGWADWAGICEELRLAATPESTSADRLELPTGYDPVTLSQVLRASVDFGEATRAGDHGKAAAALEVIAGHEALVRAQSDGQEAGRARPKLPESWREVEGWPGGVRDVLERVGPVVGVERTTLIDGRVVSRISYDGNRWHDIPPCREAALYLLLKRTKQ